MGFENLNPDLLRLISSRLPCPLDRGNMAAVCRWWCNAVTAARSVDDGGPHKLLPVLFVPHAKDAASCCAFCHGDGLKEMFLPERALQGRFFGSYDGCWLFVARGQTDEHSILSLDTHNEIELPDTMQYVNGDAISDVVIEAATLYDAPEADVCVTAAMVQRLSSDSPRQPDIMFWSVGSGATGWGLQHRAIKPDKVEDIIFFNGKFNLLTTDEHLLLVTPEFNSWFMTACVEEINPAAGHAYYPEIARCRYLVHSRGELLMVVRCGQKAGIRWYTSSFRVFRMEQPQGHPGGGYTWTELDALDGRILFVARGCSRSYEVANVPGAVEGVYFKGDMQPWSPAWFNVKKDQRCDMMDDHGVWLGPPLGPVVPCFILPEQMPHATHYSPPVWVLPHAG